MFALQFDCSALQYGRLDHLRQFDSGRGMAFLESVDTSHQETQAGMFWENPFKSRCHYFSLCFSVLQGVRPLQAGVRIAEGLQEPVRQECVCVCV